MVVRQSLYLLLILMIVLAFASPAVASFSFDVEVEEQQDPVPRGDAGELQVTVVATSSQPMACPSGGTFDVDVSVEDDDSEAGFEGDVSPNSLEFSIAGGSYGEPVQEAWTGEETTTFMPSIGEDLPHLTHTYTIRASFDGTQPADCVSPEDWSESDGSASVDVTAEEEEEEETENETENNGGQPDSEDGPAPGIGLVVIAVALAVVLRRRGTDSK